MITEWQEELIGRYPSQFEQVNDETYIQRRNVTAREATEMDPTPGYSCESRMVSEDVYQKFKEFMESPTQDEIAAKLSNSELAQAEIIANTEYISALQELAMEV